MTEDERDAIRTQQAVTNMRTVLSTLAGLDLVKYLLEEWQFGDYPALGLDAEILHSQLGTMRAARTMFDLAAMAAPEIAGNILAKIEKDRYAYLLESAQTPKR